MSNPSAMASNWSKPEETSATITEDAYKRKISTNTDVEPGFADPEPTVKDSDLKTRQKFKGWTLFWLSYQALGVVFGEIATSPLYVYSSTFTSNPSRENLLGALSLIIWSLTLMVTIKYVFIVLRADDEGEGGTFALYTFLSRYCNNIMKSDPRVQRLVKHERRDDKDLHPSTRNFRSWLERSGLIHAVLRVLAVFGVSLVLADGVLTPAQSVLGAVQGIREAGDNLRTPAVVGISCAILVLLFIIQPFGVHRISFVFAPIIIIWLIFNACFGIYNLAMHDYTVLKAFSPYFAGAWFMRNRNQAWTNLGGILLCFTGVECFFADMGAFNRRSIQLPWLFVVYPCLLLTYIGQAAYISQDPDAWDNPFFHSVPPGMFYPSLVLAILAASVASQSTITACFQLLGQLMNSSYFPHVEIRFTSNRHFGQVYIPLANYLLMIGCVIVTAVYNDTTDLGHAYGVCVILVTLITTNLVALVAIIIWEVRPILVFLVWLPFVTFDGLFLSASLVKVPEGAWFTLMLAAILAGFFTLWRYGKEQQWTSEAKEHNELATLTARSPDSGHQTLAEKFGGGDLSGIDGFGIFFDKTGTLTPKVYEHWLRKFRAQMEVVILMHLRALSVPHVAERERFELAKTNVRDVYRLIIRHGYDDHIFTPNLAELVYDEVRNALVRGVVVPSGWEQPPELDNQFPSDVFVASRLERLDNAYDHQKLYIVGKQKLRISHEHNIAKRLALQVFLWLRENTANSIEKLNIDTDSLVEVGYVSEI